ncbi:MAG: putative Ig domain-containing protein, partial [Candidatus Poseidoniaceae archaeon]
YFSAKTEATNQELFAYDTSNQSLWLVEDIRTGSQSSFVGEKMALVAGNKLVFNAKPSGTTSYLYGHEPSEVNWMTNTGGNVTTWAINNTNLPTGLTFSTSNGTIYGTPTQLWSKTAYMVWANNSGGSSVGYLNITVVDANLSYSKYDLTLTKDQASNDLPLNATTTASGTVTTWEISSTLPAGLNFGTSNGTIWGIPTVLQTTPTAYTIWANGTHGSVSASITLTIYDNAPGPFEYEPENNTWTKNTEVHLAPVFVNRTTGNGSTWQVADINSGTSGSHSAPGQHMSILVGDTIYFDAFEAATGTELWAYDTSNQSLWRVTDIRSGSGGSDPGDYSSILVGDTLYFSADDGSTGDELWAHNTSNGTTWQVANIRSGSSHSNPGSNMMHVVNGVLYFNAHDGNAGVELWKHDPSTDTTSRVKDINPGSTGSSTGKYLNTVVGDVLYFSANDGSTGSELWAYNTSNSSDPWRVMDINSGSDGSNPGIWLEILVGDTLYFSANDGSTGHELWAHDTSNHSTWRVADISNSGDGNPGRYMQNLVGDTLYFSATDGSTGDELWAHDTSNHSTWRVADIYSGSPASNPGDSMSILVGNTLYFSANDGSTGDELWAHDTSNHSTWQVVDVDPSTYGGISSSYPGDYMAVLMGDTIYFSAANAWGEELWAHDTSNHSTWRVADIYSGVTGSTPGYWMEILVGDTLYFSANDGSTGHELWAHQPSRIDENTNTGGAVTSWEINASLPSGVSFGTNNGTIYGTPTQLWTQTSYMVWANNSGGSSVAYLNITVNDEAPVISYSTTEITGTIDVALSPHVGPTTSGGTITSWEISPDPGSAFHFNSNNGYISGTPSILLSRTQYTIWANNSGGSSVAYVNVTINDVAPGPFEYNPENNTLTNNTYVHLAPQFINQTTGNGSTWQVADIRSGGGSSNPGYNMAILVGDTFYFSALDGSSGYELWAHDTSNASTWQVADIYSGTGHGFTGQYMSILVGDTLYFDATDGSSGIELWAHDTSNASTWRVADINSGAGNSNPGYYMHPILVGDTFYFDAEDGSSGRELWAHDTSNASTWRVADINSGAGHSYSGQWMGILVGDTLYFDANDGSSGGEL